MAKRLATELFERYYMALVYTLPIKDVDFMDELLKHDLLPGGVKSKLESLVELNERSSYFLDNVIKPGLAVGNSRCFVSLLTVMKCNKHDNTKDLATKIEKELTTDVKHSPKPLLKDLSNIVIPKVANKWYELGIQLLNQPQLPKLDEIQKAYPNNLQQGCFEMLKYWLEITPGASWDNLIHALRAPGLELLGIADDVEKAVKGKFTKVIYAQELDILKKPQSLITLDHPDAYFERFEDEDVVGAFVYLFNKLSILFGEVNFTQLKNAFILRGTLLPSEFKQKIRAAVELDDLLDALLDNPMCCNWLNIRLLKRIVKSINIPEAKHLIQAYEKCVYSRKVSEVMMYFDSRCFNPLHVPLVTAKIVKSTNLTVADIVEYCETLESTVGVYAGSVIATEYQPSHLQNRESYEKMLAKLEEAKAKKETIKVSYTTVMFCGASGVGKTNLIKKLNKEHLIADHSSTGVAESKHTVSIETAAVINSAEGLRWTNFNYDSMICQLNKLLLNLKSSSSEEDSQMDLDTPSLSTPPVSSSQDNIPSTSRSHSKMKTNDSAKVDSVAVDIARADLSNAPPLGEVWKVINFLDTGGQPEFVNILPAVSSSIGLTFIVFNLSESLNDLVLVKHNVDGVSSFKPYHLDCTNLDFIKRLIVSSEKFNKTVTPFKSIHMKGGEHYHSKICFLGTHALNNVSEERIQEIDDQLSSIIDELKLQQRTFWSSPTQELSSLFPIDLFPPDKHKESFDDIIQNIRDNIHKQVQEQGYYEVPITWFIFLLQLQKLCNTKNISYLSYQDAVDVWMDTNINKFEPNQDKSVGQENSDVHDILLFFHFMGMLFYYDKVEGIRDFVFIDQQWLFNKLTELVKVKFTKGCYNISPNDVNQFTKEGRLNISIIKNLKINLQGIQPLHFINLLDHLNIISPIDVEAKEYFMPCVLPTFQFTQCKLDKSYGGIQRVPLLVRFRNGPMPHGFFLHLIVGLFKELPKGWVNPHRSTRKMQHVYNNLITFPTTSNYAVTLFYKIEHLEIQVRSKQPLPSVIHSNVRHELVIILKKTADNLKLTNEQLCSGFYCKCEEKHFAAIPEDFDMCIFCDYDSVDIKEDHRAWFQDVEDDKLQQGSSVTETDICASVRTKVKSNYENLMKINADAILAGLVAKEVITLEEKQIIDAKKINREKMGYLIDTIIIPSLNIGIITKYKEFLMVLERNEDISIKTVAQGLGHSKDLP